MTWTPRTLGRLCGTLWQSKEQQSVAMEVICTSKEGLNLRELFTPLHELFDTSLNYLIPP